METCCGGKFTTEPDDRGGYRVICANGFVGGCRGLSLDAIKQMDLAAGTENGALARVPPTRRDSFFRKITTSWRIPLFERRQANQDVEEEF